MIYKLGLNLPKKEIYKRIYEYEKLLKEAEKIPIYCSYADYEPPNGKCTSKQHCPTICPKFDA